MVREIIWVEKYQVSSLCLAAVVCYQGRQPYMEDRFSVITNINNSEVSLYAVFDGHAGNFASDFAAEIILPSIGDKISDVLNITRIRADKLKKEKEKEKEAKKKKGKPNQEIPVEQEVEKNEELETPTEPDPLEEYITPENLVNYEKLLFDEIMMFDKLLIERMIKATLFCGSTANIVLVDLTNKLVICANVGDSRAVLCDSKGNAVALSHDHKPDNPEELERIRASGGYISNKNGCWRVEGSLACSRSIGDYPLKHKKVIIADPDIQTYKFKDFKNLPKFIVLGSDGLFDAFKNQEICDYTKTKLKETHYGARSLMKKAYARKSADNITAIVIKFIKPKAPKKEKPSYDLTSNNYEWLK